MIGLPIPPSAIYLTDTGPVFVSLKFGPLDGSVGETPPPIIARDFVEDHPTLALGVLIFDVWVANRDRNLGNLAYVKGLWEPWVYDFSHALLGFKPVPVDLQSLSNETDPYVGTELAQWIRDSAGFYTWIERIESIPTSLIEQVCSEAEDQWILSAQDAFLVKRYLVERRGRLRDMIPQIESVLPNLQNRGLI